MSSKVNCSTCKKEMAGPGENKLFPFCSERCRTIDLGRWLGEEYRLVNDTVEDDEDGGPDDPGVRQPVE